MRKLSGEPKTPVLTSTTAGLPLKPPFSRRPSNSVVGPALPMVKVTVWPEELAPARMVPEPPFKPPMKMELPPLRTLAMLVPVPRLKRTLLLPVVPLNLPSPKGRRC